jgi:hypothetical protein
MWPYTYDTKKRNAQNREKSEENKREGKRVTNVLH